MSVNDGVQAIMIIVVLSGMMVVILHCLSSDDGCEQCLSGKVVR